MAQNFFGTLTSPSTPLLDANFSELYAGVTVLDNVVAQKYKATTGFFEIFPYLSSVGGALMESVNTAGTTYTNLTLNALAFSFSAASGSISIDASANIFPSQDNSKSCGIPSKRFSVYYGATGAINTSDARDKTAVVLFGHAELAAAELMSKEIGTYQWLSALQIKGNSARRHVGLTVQRAIEIMRSQGLDPMAYGFICYDQWPEQVQPARTQQRDTGLRGPNGESLYETVIIEPEKVIPAGDRYSFRPDELLMFIARGMEARLSALEAAA